MMEKNKNKLYVIKHTYVHFTCYRFGTAMMSTERKGKRKYCGNGILFNKPLTLWSMVLKIIFFFSI